RFFIDDRGANPFLRYEDYDIDVINNSRYLYFNGYSFQDDGFLEDISRLLSEVNSKTSIVFGPGAPNLAKKYRNDFLKLIKKHVAVVILNEEEAISLTGENSTGEIIGNLLKITDIVALTLGARGSIVANHQERIRLKACKAEVVDTTGAGDGYTGAFLYGLSRGWSLKKAGELAGKVAASVVSVRGARVKHSQLHKLT
ncbi:MAG: hypothetical protein JW856_02875, partial [Dehalococcoidales bacterium]|nr:hypothetical protein [Dehalococcoidales bacterium]